MTEKTNAQVVAARLSESAALLERVRKTGADQAAAAAEAIVAALKSGGKLLLFGNGGSAADAQHVASELVGRFEQDRAPLAAIALTTDTSVLTSIGNDDSYERVFARQVEAIGRAGDIAFGISTSGLSPNVISGLESARARGLKTVGMTGRDGGHVGRVSDIHVNVPAESTARVQEVHRTLLHAICEIVESAFVEN